MKMALKIGLSFVASLVCALCMFYCFVAGAPDEGTGLLIYMTAAGGFSILVSAALCGAFWYIRYLQKRIEKMEKPEK